MRCMDNTALVCKLQCISLHALKSSAHAVTCAHHICGFTFNCRFISCMIFWEIILRSSSSLMRVCILCVLTALVEEAACTCLSVYPRLLQRLWHYTLSRVQERILHTLCVFAESCVQAYDLFNTIQPVDTKPTWFLYRNWGARLFGFYLELYSMFAFELNI